MRSNGSGPSRFLIATFIVLSLLIWLPRGLELDHFVTADEHAWLTRSANFYRAIAHGDFAGTFQRHHPGVSITWAGTIAFLMNFPAYPWESPGEFGWLTEEIEPFLYSREIEPIAMLAAGRAVVVVIISAALLIAFALSVTLLGFRPSFVGFGLIALSPFHIGLSRLLHLDGMLSTLMLLSLMAFITHLNRRSGKRESVELVGTEKCNSIGDGGRHRDASNRHRRFRALILSGICAGLAWLTRSPGLFLVPYCAALYLIDWLRSRLSRGQSGVARSTVRFSQMIVELSLWTAIGCLTFVALWPAMWVVPFESVVQVLDAGRNYASEGHLKPIFFNGHIYSGDPGWRFYPISYLWRSTPVTLIGVIAALIGIFRTSGIGVSIAGLLRISADQKQGGISSAGSGASRSVRTDWEIDTLIILISFALSFALFMNLGAKKFDRYLLPAFLPLHLVAGWGWIYLFALVERWFMRTSGSNRKQIATPGVPDLPRSANLLWSFAIALVIAAQASFSLPTFPYYLSYYNPLMGGAAAAPAVMQIGWGEGADQAAQFISEFEDSDKLRVASAYTNGPFSYFFQGATLPIYFWHDADYAVLYAQDWQRRLPSPRQIRHFEMTTPIYNVTINRLEYAQIFDLSEMALPDYVSDWRAAANEADEPSQIRLVSYQLPSSIIAPGQSLPLTLYLVSLSPIEENLNILVQLVGPEGNEVARSEGWPFGAATSDWKPRQVWPDGHMLPIPPTAEAGPHRLDISFYHPESQERLLVSQAATGTLLGDRLVLDFVQIGSNVRSTTNSMDPAISVGPALMLTGVSWLDASGVVQNAAVPTVTSGQSLKLNLTWLVSNHVTQNYTMFVHVVHPDGTLLTQTDEQPWKGFYPTSFWTKGRLIDQTLQIDVPPEAPSGTYQVHVGLYDSDTIERLPVMQGESVTGDSIDNLFISIQNRDEE